MSDANIYLVTYDVRDERRLRQVFRILRGYGEWVQYSVFQCRLSRRRRADLIALVDDVIHHSEDHVLLVDLGPAASVAPRITSLGRSFVAIEHEPVIV